MSVDRLWQLNARSEVALREWGDGVVVYVGDRASTHLLSAAAGRTLVCLVDALGALTVEALFASAFAESTGDPTGEAMTPAEHAALYAVLAEFEQLGIAERVPGISAADPVPDCTHAAVVTPIPTPPVGANAS